MTPGNPHDWAINAILTVGAAFPELDLGKLSGLTPTGPRMYHSPMSTYGSELRRLRETKPMSLRRLAKEIGYSAPYLSDVERGFRLPFTEDVTEKILNVLGVASKILRIQAVVGRVRAKHPGASELTIRKITNLLMKDSGKQEG